MSTATVGFLRKQNYVNRLGTTVVVSQKRIIISIYYSLFVDLDNCKRACSNNVSCFRKYGIF